MMYAMDQRASLNSDQIEGIKTNLKSWTPFKIPGQGMGKSARQAELDKLYAYKHTITQKVLWNLSQVSVDRIRISVFLNPTKYIQQIKTLTYDHIIRENLDYLPSMS
jgi:hypothetical protein